MNTFSIQNNELVSTSEPLKPEERAEISRKAKARVGIKEPGPVTLRVVDPVTFFCDQCGQAEVSEKKKVCPACVTLIANRAAAKKAERDGRLLLLGIGVVFFIILAVLSYLGEGGR